MRAWMIASVGLGAWACGGDDGAKTPAIERSPLCPDDPITLVGHTVFCGGGDPDRIAQIGAAGLECRYAAYGCTSGEKLPNVCHCHPDGRFDCDDYLRTCVPLSDDAGEVSTHARPMPAHRAAPVVCPDPAKSQGASLACASDHPSGAGGDECVHDSQCARGDVCLEAHSFEADTLCRCVAVECLGDDDCGDGQTCDCGAIDSSAVCGYPQAGLGCAHRCVTATCRQDSDCGARGFCSPSYDACHEAATAWACHQNGDDECVSNAECVFSADGPECRYRGDLGWRCSPRPICD